MQADVISPCEVMVDRSSALHLLASIRIIERRAYLHEVVGLRHCVHWGVRVVSENASTTGKKRELWKLIPGFAVSGFFLWKTLKSIRFDDLRSIRVASSMWIAVLIVFLFSGYLLRIYRWWFMLRRSGAPGYAVCARVLLTSYAANNVLPFRIGDFLRVFSYAPDLRASSSTVLSTVILERLLDVFTLLTFLVVLLLHAGRPLLLPLRGHNVDVLHLATPVLALCAAGLFLLLFGASFLQKIVERLIGRIHAGPRAEKFKSWALLLFHAVLKLSLSGRILLLLSSLAIWLCEGMIFVGASGALAVPVGRSGPWLAVTLSNLSFLLPSSPGAIGTYEFFSKVGMVSQGAPQTISALYGLLVHMIVFFSVTLAGGIVFLVHRVARGPRSRPLAQDLADLPEELPVRVSTPTP